MVPPRRGLTHPDKGASPATAGRLSLLPRSGIQPAGVCAAGKQAERQGRCPCNPARDSGPWTRHFPDSHGHNDRSRNAVNFNVLTKTQP